MVLEHLLPARTIEKKLHFSFFLGIVYALIGILIARLLFPADPSLVAVAFTSILLLPLLRKFFSLKEKKQKQETSFTIKHLLRDEGDFIKVYLLIAFGIFLVYCFSSFLLPEFAVNSLFREQLELRGIGGKAYSADLFLDILINNWWVLVACIVLSFLTGDGAIFLVTWNASLWGTIFGVTVRDAAIASGANAWYYLLMVLLIVLPHAFIEMLSYILGGISGGLISSDIEVDGKEKKRDRFKSIFYSYAGSLFIGALVMLLLGAVVETYVLNNSNFYQHVIYLSLK